MIHIPLDPTVLYFKQLWDLLTLPYAGVNAVSKLTCTMGPDPTSPNSASLPEVHSSTLSHTILPFSLKSLNFTSFLFSAIPLCHFSRKIFIISREWTFQPYINTEQELHQPSRDTDLTCHLPSWDCTWSTVSSSAVLSTRKMRTC